MILTDRQALCLSDTFSHSEASDMSPVLETRTAAPARPLGDVNVIATIYDCSKRHVYRMADAGKIPRPLKVGSLVRWRLRTGDPMTGVLDHIEAGCPSCRDRGARR